MAVSDISVDRMIKLGVSPAKAVSAAVAASNTTSAAGFNQVVTDAGGTVTTSPTYPPAGTPISQSESPNADGTFTITTVVADGKGGQTTTTSISGTPTATTAASDALAAQQLVNKTNQANAAAQATALLQSYGLSADIGAGITALAQNGLDSTTITSILDAPNPTTAITALNLQGSQLTAANQLVTSWQARFPGNQARIAAGLNPIDPATYIANETAYKQVMTMAGIPASSPLMQTSYLGNLMAQDVSPAEVQQRVSTATSAIQNEDPMVIAQLQSQYGLSQSSILSHLLDPTVSAPVIQQEYNAATIAAEAARAGVAITVGNTGGNVQGGGLLNNNSLQMQLAAQGVTQSQAQQGFQAIAAQQPALESIAGRYGAGITGPANIGQALTAATFNTTGAAAAQQQINLLKTAETAAFSGSAGAVTGSLGPRDTSGLQ